MYQQKESNIVTGKNLPVSNLEGWMHPDPTIGKLIIIGSDSFVSLYIEELKKSLGEGIDEISIKYSYEAVLSDIMVRKGYPYESLSLRNILTVLAETLKYKSTTMIDTTIISYGKYTLKIESDVLEAVHAGDEITYILGYTLSKAIRGEKAEGIKSVVGYYHDTCHTYFYKNKMTTDRYYYSNESEPLPITDIDKVCSGAWVVLSQFCEVQAIECVIKATGVKGEEFIALDF